MGAADGVREGAREGAAEGAWLGANVGSTGSVKMNPAPSGPAYALVINVLLALATASLLPIPAYEGDGVTVYADPYTSYVSLTESCLYTYTDPS